MITPIIIKNDTSVIPVFLKNASPATPRNITTPAASNIIGAEAIGASCIDNEETDVCISVNLFKITDELISENEKPSICDVIKFKIAKLISFIIN